MAMYNAKESGKNKRTNTTARQMFRKNPDEQVVGRRCYELFENKDVTDYKNLTNKLRQAQKMESIGTLFSKQVSDKDDLSPAIKELLMKPVSRPNLLNKVALLMQEKCR